LLLEDLLEQEKREQQQQHTPGQPSQVVGPQQQVQQQPPQQQPQQQQMPQPPHAQPGHMPTTIQNPQQQPQVMPVQAGQLPPGAVMQQARPQMQNQGPPPGAYPVGGGMPQGMMMHPQHQQRPSGMPGMMPGQGQWQVRHAQEVTLQQRGPMGVGPPPHMMGMRGPHPQRMGMDQHPALMRQDPTPPPPPPPLNNKAMSPPPENPQTDEEKAKVVRYEQWLSQQEQAINQQLRYYETEISKLRKQRKV
jgi:hypothetical protein